MNKRPDPVGPPAIMPDSFTDERKVNVMKSMKKLIAILTAMLILLMSVSALAETRITVNATGEVRVSADTAVISLGVNACDRDVLKAQKTVNEAIAAIRKALTDQGVKEENISTEYINIYAMYDYENDIEKVAAYNAGSTLAVRTTDMESVGSLIDVCFAAGANTLNGISFSASDTEEAKTEAMQYAVEDAKMKAEVLAEASGLKITGIESISEGDIYSYENSIGNVYAKGMDIAETEEDAGTVVQAAKLIVSVPVTMTFTAE